MKLFILCAFDMARDIQITPKRIEYAKEKEAELYESLNEIVLKKHDEIKEIIGESVEKMKQNVPNLISEHEFTCKYFIKYY